MIKLNYKFKKKYNLIKLSCKPNNKSCLIKISYKLKKNIA